MDELLKRQALISARKLADDTKRLIQKKQTGQAATTPWNPLCAVNGNKTEIKQWAVRTIKRMRQFGQKI
jgi:hypothetical protein